MKFRLEFEMENDAFQPEPRIEAGYILERVREKLDACSFAIGDREKVRDTNGNTVGYFTVLS